MDFTGTGNSLNIVHPRTMALIMDSLRYWVTDMHVDGFRFDLAPVLVRGYDDGTQPLLRDHPAGPGSLPGEADRRAMGRGPDGYRLGVPSRMGRVERSVP